VSALATHGFEQDELLRPRKALEDAGAKVDIVSPESGRIRGWKHKQWGDEVSVDRTLEQAKPSDYDALLLPDDIPAFNRKMLEEFAEGKHGGGGKRALAGTHA
jgi:putative intracellular protease/amidase